MAYTMSEKKILRRLGITDFRHMTKDKVVKFASMLPYMDPTVAKAAIAQFPEFKDLSVQIVKSLQETVEKSFGHAKESQQALYDACNKIIDILHEELMDENIDSAERARIEDHMIELARIISEKDSEFKRFLLKNVEVIFLGAAFVTTMAAAAVGGVADMKGSNSDDEDEDEDDESIAV